MSEPLSEINLVRHGETEWTLSRRHTGLTDIPLTERGERDANKLGEYLKGKRYARVFTSPLRRAKRTCELAGFGAVAEVVPDLVEWNYGEYEGLTTAEILKTRPGWNLFRDGCPVGESVAAIGARADKVVERLRAIKGDVCLFAHAHILRVLTARWLSLDASGGRFFLLHPTTLSILGYEHNTSEPVVRLWKPCTNRGVKYALHSLRRKALLGLGQQFPFVI